MAAAVHVQLGTASGTVLKQLHATTTGEFFAPVEALLTFRYNEIKIKPLECPYKRWKGGVFRRVMRDVAKGYSRSAATLHCQLGSINCCQCS